jgi:uncharacterized protein (TIGR03067 family)
MILPLAVLALTSCGKKSVDGETGAAASNGDPRLAGTYRLITTEFGGSVVNETEQKGNYTFSGDKMISPNGKSEEAATVKCNPDTLPPEITISKKDLSGKVTTLYGIYQLEGDTLKLCLIKADRPEERPREFKTSPDTKTLIEVFKKIN